MYMHAYSWENYCKGIEAIMLNKVVYTQGIDYLSHAYTLQRD